MDLLYIHESDFARGTIAHLKNDFDHRSFKKQVSANVQHSWDMMEVSIIVALPKGSGKFK